MLFRFFLSLLAIFSTAKASEYFHTACTNALHRGKVSFYETLTAPIIYYGLVVIPFVLVVVLYILSETDFFVNFTQMPQYIAMVIGYSGVLIFDAMSRRYINTFIFNVVYQLQIIAMFATKYLVLGTAISLEQGLGIILITIAISYIAGQSAHDIEKPMYAHQAYMGWILVGCASVFRAVAIVMDGAISTTMFSAQSVAIFSLPWRLYETTTFVLPALVLIVIQGTIYLRYRCALRNPRQLFRSEMKDRIYRPASTAALGEYIFGVPVMQQFPYIGPLVQGLVPVMGLIMDSYRTRVLPHHKTLLALSVLVLGAMMLL